MNEEDGIAWNPNESFEIWEKVHEHTKIKEAQKKTRNYIKRMFGDVFKRLSAE